MGTMSGECTVPRQNSSGLSGSGGDVAVEQGTEPERVGPSCTSSEAQLRAKLIAKSPVADIVIGGVRASCVLDTGAETSLISYDFYKEHLADQVGGLGTVGTFITLVGANDLEIPIAGYLETPVDIFGSTINASFLVRSNALKTANKNGR